MESRVFYEQWKYDYRDLVMEYSSIVIAVVATILFALPMGMKMEKRNEKRKQSQDCQRTNQ